MVKRMNDDAIVEALKMLDGVIRQALNVNVGKREEDAFRALGNFRRNNLLIFEEEHEPGKAQAWLKAV